MATQTLLKQFRESNSEDRLVGAGELVVVGLSGGVDSVALVHLLKETGVLCHAAHVNYGFRGSESDEDEDFVVGLCERLDIPCSVYHPPAGWPQASGDSLQEAARDLRYQLFESLAAEVGGSKVAVAHHLDDQVETVLLRLVRGTGLRGLAGMRRRRPISEGSNVELIRPLLSMTRNQIMQWASDEGIDYREDRSNEDPRFDRVRMRSMVVPSISEAFGEAGLRNIVRSAEQAQEAFDAVVAERLEADLTAAIGQGDYPTLAIDALMKHERRWRTMLLLEAVRRWVPGAPERATIANQIAALLEAQPGKRFEVANSVIWRGRGTIVFVDNDLVPDRPRSTQLVPGKPVDIGSGVMLIEELPPVEDGAPPAIATDRDPNTEFVDERILQAPISVGRWHPGDRFQPLGMTGSKNMSDFLTDQKVESHLKSVVSVVKSGGEVVWVVGHRLADPFRVRPDSKHVVRLSFTPQTTDD